MTTEWTNADERREETARVLAACWRNAASPGPDYAELLPALLDGPDRGGGLSPLGMTDGAAACAMLVIRRLLSVASQPVGAALLTAWAVDPGRRGQGLGLAVFAESLLRARRAGLGGVLWFTVAELPTGAMSTRVARDCGWHVTGLGTREWLSRPLARVAPAAGAVVDEGAPMALVRASDAARAGRGIARILDWREASWQAIERPGAVSCTAEAPSGMAVAAGWCVPLLDRAASRVAFLDHVAWAGLGASGRRALLDEFCARASREGAALASVSLDPRDEDGFAAHRDAGFRRTGRRMHAWLALRSPPADDGACAPSWIDVF